MNMCLKLGSIGPDVVDLRARLAAQGFDPGSATSPTFDEALENEVRDFQAGHLGPDGRYLVTDGEVGGLTLWALNHASGAPQKSNLGDPVIPAGLTPLRAKVLEIAAAEYRAGVHEVPDGANQGDGVDKYIAGAGSAQWCCAFVSWCFHEAVGDWPFGHREFSTWAAWQWCKPRQMFKPIHQYEPIPGDFMLIQHSRRGSYTHTGHIGIVLAVLGREFNTIAGNEGNRVKLGLRDVGQSDLVGFLNVYAESEQGRDYQRGLVSRDRIGNIQTT